jgi:hypothetical protein
VLRFLLHSLRKRPVLDVILVGRDPYGVRSGDALRTGRSIEYRISYTIYTRPLWLLLFL